MSPKRARAIQDSILIKAGEMFASRTGAILRTTLGSCIAVCLHDPEAKVGGMNHYLLPYRGEEKQISLRYGSDAIRLLVQRCVKLGADPHRLQAKVFGGGHVLAIPEREWSVPKINIQFAQEYLYSVGIETVARDIGGTCAREVYFYTDTGLILLRRIKREHARDVDFIEIEASDQQSMRTWEKKRVS